MTTDAPADSLMPSATGGAPTPKVPAPKSVMSETMNTDMNTDAALAEGVKPGAAAPAPGPKHLESNNTLTDKTTKRLKLMRNISCACNILLIAAVAAAVVLWLGSDSPSEEDDSADLER